MGPLTARQGPYDRLAAPRSLAALREVAAWRDQAAAAARAQATARQAADEHRQQLEEEPWDSVGGALGIVKQRGDGPRTGNGQWTAPLF